MTTLSKVLIATLNLLTLAAVLEAVNNQVSSSNIHLAIALLFGMVYIIYINLVKEA